MKHSLYKESRANPNSQILINCDDRLGEMVTVSLYELLEMLRFNRWTEAINVFDIRDAREEDSYDNY